MKNNFPLHQEFGDITENPPTQIVMITSIY